jgi:hypothetical protein
LDESVRLSEGTVREGFEAQKKSHLEYVGKCRSNFSNRAKFARENRTQVLFINIDGMDQCKTGIPVAESKAKSDGVGQPLTTKLMGAIAYGYGFYGFWSLPEWGASSNLTLTAMCRVIRDISKNGPLPETLHIQMDNTAKDNKNHYLLGFCAMLIAEHVFTEVVVFFLPVGHTHQDIDQTFSCISHALSQGGAYSLPHLMKIAKDAWKGHEHVGTADKVHLEIKQVLDFRRLLRFHGDNRAMEQEDDDPGRPRVITFKGLGTNRSNKRYLFVEWLAAFEFCLILKFLTQLLTNASFLPPGAFIA